MSNPLNPLNWLKTAQDWFTKTERSSGFRPYLIFLMLIFIFSLICLFSFQRSEIIINFSLVIVGITILCFIVLFAIKCFQDPEFCRSEKHVEVMKKIELEKMGTEQKQIDAQIVDNEQVINSPDQLLVNIKKD